VDVRRIAFVTERFSELQGLRTVADALPAFIFAAGLHWARSSPGVILLFGGLAAYFALRVTWIRSGIEAYYSRRLGRVEPSVPDLDPTLLFAHVHRPGRVDRSGSNFEGIVLFYQGLLAVPVGRDLPLPPFVQIALLASMLGFLPLRILIRDWRYRVHWLLPLGVAVVFALRLAADVSAREFDDWRVLMCLSGGVALAVAGVCDHRLLVKSLGGGAAATSTAEYADIN
jgi:hypothetical protein